MEECFINGFFTGAGTVVVLIIFFTMWWFKPEKYTEEEWLEKTKSKNGEERNESDSFSRRRS